MNKPSRFKVELAAIDWKEFHWQIGARRVPALLFLLWAAVCIHEPAAGVLAAGTALPVGFAGGRQVNGSRLLAMAATTCLVTACALVGTLAGNSYELSLVAAAIGGFICGFLALASEDSGWVAIQGVIAFLIGSSYAGSLLDAAERAAFICAGGVAQTLIILLIWQMQGISRFGPEIGAVKDSKNEKWFELFKKAMSSSISYRFGLRVAITLALAVELDHLLKLKNGYWLAMTTLIVLKPDFDRTYTGGIQRVAGTLAGVLFASLIAAVLHPGLIFLIALVLATCWLTFSAQKVNAVIFSGALTSCAIFLIAVTGLPESTVTWHRFINTALGCALALTSHFVGFFIIHPSAPAVAKSSAKELAVKS